MDISNIWNTIKLWFKSISLLFRGAYIWCVLSMIRFYYKVLKKVKEEDLINYKLFRNWENRHCFWVYETVSLFSIFGLNKMLKNNNDINKDINNIFNQFNKENNKEK